MLTFILSLIAGYFGYGRLVEKCFGIAEAAETPAVRLRPVLIFMMLGPFAGLFAADTQVPFAGLVDSAPFIGGKEGYKVYRAPTLTVSTKGTVLAFCEGRVNGHSDEDDIDVVLKRSADGGRTWEPLQVLVNDGRNPCKNQCPVVLPSGRILLVWLWNQWIPSEKERTTREVFVMHSDDDGVTWSKPRNITASVYKPGWTWYGTGPCHAIVKQCEPNIGRIVIPARHGSRHGKICAHIIYSDDGGQTWHIGGSVDRPQTSEGTVVELSNGDLMFNTRNQNDEEDFRVVALSRDGGATFPEVWLETQLVEPRGCQGSLLFHSLNHATGKGNILFSNPANREVRADGTLKLSEDDGRTWVKSFRYARKPAPNFTGYSDIAVMPDGCVGVLYERGDLEDASLKSERYDEIGFTVVPFGQISTPLSSVSETGLVSLAACRLPAEARPIRFAWEILPASEIKPDGWLRYLWSNEFRQGMAGRLDVINNDVAQDVFAAQDRDMDYKGKPSWWSGEQEGYWHEAYIHAAFQVGTEADIKRATEYVDRILNSQTPAGYLGVYAAESRLLPPGDPRYGERGGELHTQAHLFLSLLAFYEHTNRDDVLRAVEKAAQLSMRTYCPDVFGKAGKGTAMAGGNSHIVSFIDPMVQLYRLTGDECYLRYLETMYRSYTQQRPRDHDLTPENLDDPQSPFTGHGAHTAESFHWISALTLLGDAETNRRAGAAMQKLKRHLTPGGALISDEDINGRLGNGHDMYEYCAQSELIKSFAWIAQYRGDPAAAECAARLYLNGSLGARLHPLAALQYLSRDDRLDIPFAEKQDGVKGVKKSSTHFRFSSGIRPSCCPASAGRPAAYYLSSAWMKRPDASAIGLVNMMPSTVETVVNGALVRIVEETAYPFSDCVELSFSVSQPVGFSLAIRLPPEGELLVDGASLAEREQREGFLWVHRVWQTGDKLHLTLRLPVVLEKTQDGSAWYYRRGSLTYGLPFKTGIQRVRENPDWRSGVGGGLWEYDVRVADRSAWGYRVDCDARFHPVELPGNPFSPWTEPTIGLSGTMLDEHGETVQVTLVPQAAAVSRRVTFLDKTHSAQEAAQLPRGARTSIGK